MKNLITAILICVYCGLAAQPGPRRITLNLNNYTPSFQNQREARYGVVEYYFVIDSTTDISKLANLHSFASLKLVIALKAIPPEIRLLSDSLQRLDIYGGDRPSDISALRSLEHLTDLTFFSLGQETLPNLGGIPNLQSLTIFGGKIKDIQGLSYSKSLKNVRLNGMDSLREINLKPNNIAALSIEDLKNLKSITGISNRNQLEKLDLYRCGALKDISAVASLRSLTSLRLFGLDLLEGFNFDMSKMNLDEMEISGCESMRDISGIASCKTLRKLTLNYISKYITALKFDMSAMNLSDLKIAGDDYYWSPITDISGITSCRSLQSLELSNLDSLKVIDFKNKVTGLQSLRIEDCKSLETVSGLSNCRALSVLEIKENPRLKKIPDLKSEIPFVKGIIIHQNRSLKIPDYFSDLTHGHEWDIFDNGK